MRALSAPPLLLEPLVAAHADEMVRVLSDPAIYEFENTPPTSKDVLRQRYTMLERRRSPDDAETWLNWVIRLPTGDVAGYMQATVLSSCTSYVAYELASRYWRQGIGTTALAAVLTELRLHYGVRRYVAVLKSRNHRSRALLRKLHFAPASPEEATQLHLESDEIAMIRPADESNSADSET